MYLSWGESMSKTFLTIVAANIVCLASCLPGTTAQEVGPFKPNPRTLENLPAFQPPNQEPAQPGLQAQPPQTSQDSNGAVTVHNCGVQLIEDIDLPAREAGQLVEVRVHEGDMVKRDQLVARIDDTLARRSLEESTFRHQMSSSKANDTTEIDSARRLLEYAEDRYQKSRALYIKGNESEAKYNEALTNLEIQRLKLASAENERKIAAIDAQAEMVKVNAAQDSIQRHALMSPVNGVVFEVAKQGSEWVNAGEKVLRIARMDRLRVIGRVDHTRFDPSQVANRRVTATATLANGRQVEFSGQVVFVALEKVGSEEHEVWAEVDNRIENDFWQLLPGSNVSLTIHYGEAPLPPRATSQISGPLSNQPASLAAPSVQR